MSLWCVAHEAPQTGPPFQRICLEKKCGGSLLCNHTYLTWNEQSPLDWSMQLSVVGQLCRYRWCHPLIVPSPESIKWMSFRCGYKLICPRTALKQKACDAPDYLQFLTLRGLSCNCSRWLIEETDLSISSEPFAVFCWRVVVKSKVILSSEG